VLAVHKVVTVIGYTKIISPENLYLKAANVVIKGANILLSATEKAGEMSC